MAGLSALTKASAPVTTPPVMSPAAPSPRLWAPADLVAILTARIGPAFPELRIAALPEEAGAIAALEGEGPGLILWPDLAEVLARLEPGPDLPRQGLSLWMTLCEAILTHQAGRRRRLALAPAGRIADPATLAAALQSCLGLQLPALSEGAETGFPAPPPAARALAETILQTSDRGRQMADRLEAASLALPEGEAPTDPFSDLEAATRAASRHHALDLRRREIAAEITAQEARHREDGLAAELAKAKAEASRLAEELADARAAATTSTATLMAQIEAASQRATMAEGESADLAKELRERDTRMAELAQEVQDLRASTSWRVTGPLRAVSLGLRHLRK